MKDYNKTIFIKISDNNDHHSFYIDISTMKDPRLRMSAIKTQYQRYLETGELYRPIYDIMDKDYSFYCLHKANCKDLDEAKIIKEQLLKEQREKVKKAPQRIKNGLITFD